MTTEERSTATMSTRQWNTTSGLESISVMTWVHDGTMGKPSTCSATDMGQLWYLNRVIVHRNDRRQGIGKQLVSRLQEALKERWDFERDQKERQVLIVEPHGYNSDPKDLEKFYLACGFQVTDREFGITMEWRPE